MLPVTCCAEASGTRASSAARATAQVPAALRRAGLCLFILAIPPLRLPHGGARPQGATPVPQRRAARSARNRARTREREDEARRAEDGRQRENAARGVEFRIVDARAARRRDWMGADRRTNVVARMTR